MLAGRVVGNEVNEHPDPVIRGFGDETDRIVERAEPRIDVAIVGHVVSTVVERRHVPGTHPDGIHPQSLQVGQARSNAGDVAGAVAIPIGERAGIDLIDDGSAPPRSA